LIRLDDLIPKKNVVGGRQLLFGATDTQQTNQNKEEEENRYKDQRRGVLNQRIRPFLTVADTLDVENKRRFKVAARFSVAGGKIPETLPVMGCIMYRDPNSL
jgi:hypothetical protein